MVLFLSLFILGNVYAGRGVAEHVVIPLHEILAPVHRVVINEGGAQEHLANMAKATDNAIQKHQQLQDAYAKAPQEKSAEFKGKTNRDALLESLKVSNPDFVNKNKELLIQYGKDKNNIELQNQIDALLSQPRSIADINPALNNMYKKAQQGAVDATKITDAEVQKFLVLIQNINAEELKISKEIGSDFNKARRNVQKLLTQIRDEYKASQPSLQKSDERLNELAKKIDAAVYPLVANAPVGDAEAVAVELAQYYKDTPSLLERIGKFMQGALDDLVESLRKVGIRIAALGQSDNESVAVIDSALEEQAQQMRAAIDTRKTVAMAFNQQPKLLTDAIKKRIDTVGALQGDQRVTELLKLRSMVSDLPQMKIELMRDQADPNYQKRLRVLLDLNPLLSADALEKAFGNDIYGTVGNLTSGAEVDTGNFNKTYIFDYSVPVVGRYLSKRDSDLGKRFMDAVQEPYKKIIAAIKSRTASKEVVAQIHDGIVRFTLLNLYDLPVTSYYVSSREQALKESLKKYGIVTHEQVAQYVKDNLPRFFNKDAQELRTNDASRMKGKLSTEEEKKRAQDFKETVGRLEDWMLVFQKYYPEDGFIQSAKDALADLDVQYAMRPGNSRASGQLMTPLREALLKKLAFEQHAPLYVANLTADPVRMLMQRYLTK